MNILTNVILLGKIIEEKNKCVFIGKNNFKKDLKIYFLNENKKNINGKEFKEIILNLYNDYEIGINKFNNIVNGNQYFVIKNCIKTKDNIYNCIINNQNIELINNNNLIINMDIKKIIEKNKEKKYKSATLYDLINHKVNKFDYSVSIDEINNINNINKIFRIIENNIKINNTTKPFNYGIKEMQFLEKLGEKPYLKMKMQNYEELKKFFNLCGYKNALKEYFFEYFYKLEEEAELIDLFMKYKQELNKKNFSIINDIKKTIFRYGLNNCPIHLNYKIKINNKYIEEFNDFILNYIIYILEFYYNSLNELDKCKYGYQDKNGKIIFNKNILKKIYLKDLIYYIQIPEDKEDFKITKIYIYNNYGKRYLYNISNFGLSTIILDKLEELLKD